MNKSKYHLNFKCSKRTFCVEYNLKFKYPHRSTCVETSTGFEQGLLLKKRISVRRKRDRELSRILIKRILKVLKRKRCRKQIQLFVEQNLPSSSYITYLCQNYKMWMFQRMYHSDSFYSKYAINMRNRKCKARQQNLVSLRFLKQKSFLSVSW